MKHVMHYSRCTDREIISTYKKWVRTINNETEEVTATRVGVSTSMGYISSVDKTRESLEKLYKLDS